MAYIESFRIDGLAGRTKPYEQKLNRSVNVFFGLNGSGKTSLLKILHSAMTQNSKILAGVPFKAAEVKMYSVTYKKTLTFTIENNSTTTDKKKTVKFQGSEINVLDIHSKEWVSQWKSTPTIPGKTGGGWSHQYLPTTRLYLSTGFSNRLLQARLGATTETISEEFYDHLFQEAIEAVWSKHAATALSSVRQAQESGLAAILQAVLSGSSSKSIKDPLPADQAYSIVKSFLKRQGNKSITLDSKTFNKKYENGKELQSVVRDIDIVERQIEKQMQPMKTMESMISSLFNGKKLSMVDNEIRIETKDGKRIGLGSLSSGEKHLVKILVEALIVEDNTLMIDEPELSMHIDWQKRLLSDMMNFNPGAQYIIATHSPEIMATLDDSAIFRL